MGKTDGKVAVESSYTIYWEYHYFYFLVLNNNFFL